MAAYFNIPAIHTIDDLRSQYKDLAFNYHPDKTGRDTNAEMADINNEYEELMNNLLSGSSFTKNEIEKEIAIDQAYLQTLNELAKFDNIILEIIGSWIWISGDTKPIKEVIKTLNFHYSPNKQMWYLNTTGQKARYSKNMDIDKIRNKYGSKVFPTGSKKIGNISGVQKSRLTKLLKNLIKRIKNK